MCPGAAGRPGTEWPEMDQEWMRGCDQVCERDHEGGDRICVVAYGGAHLKNRGQFPGPNRMW